MDASKKTLKRKRQRLKRKEKLLKISSTENQAEDQEEMNKSTEKSKEQILAERQAKKNAKQQVKKKDSDPAPSVAKAVEVKSEVKAVKPVTQVPLETKEEGEKSRDQVHSEREARKLAKQATKKKCDVPAVAPVEKNQSESKVKVAKANSEAELAVKMEKLQIAPEEAPGKSKAERRAIQEAQRAAKAKALEEKKPAVKKAMETPLKTAKVSPSSTTAQKVPPAAVKSSALHKVKLFKHLYSDKCDLHIKVNHHLHPAIIKLGLQYQSDSVVGSNARCYAFLNAMKILINDYATPPEKDFSRGLEAEIQQSVEFLQNCRPLAVSVTNALKYIKVLISLENSSESDAHKKQRLTEKINTYATEQIEMAAKAISLKVREKISNGDVILTYGCSSLIKRTLVEACKESELRFRVIVVDSRPDHEGQEMLKSLTVLGINCTYILINAITFVMPEVTKVLLGAHALLANGYVMSRVGTAQIALVSKYYNVPVLACCETHKFSERVQTDAFVFNEIGDPNALVKNKNSGESFEHLRDWETIPHLTPLNLRYDFTPPELVTAVVTEVAILPCTSVQVILRVKPAE